MQAFGILIVIIGLFLGLAQASDQKSGSEMVVAAKGLIEKGIAVIDVRQEACEGYVKGASLISIDEISKKTPEVQKKLSALTKNNKKAKIAVYCKAGIRAQMAQEALQEMGYTNVDNLGGVGTYFDEKLMEKCK